MLVLLVSCSLRCLTGGLFEKLLSVLRFPAQFEGLLMFVRQLPCRFNEVRPSCLLGGRSKFLHGLGGLFHVPRGEWIVIVLEASIVREFGYEVATNPLLL